MISLFQQFSMLLELITLPGFPLIPLSSNSFPSKENIMKIYLKLRSIVQMIITVRPLIQHQQHPFGLKSLDYSINIPL